MSYLSKSINIVIFVLLNIAALSVVTNVWNEPRVSFANGLSNHAVQDFNLISGVSTSKGIDAATEIASPYPYPIPVQMTRSGSEVSLLAQIIDLFLTMSFSANDMDQGMEVNLYRLDSVNPDVQARIIGSAFKTEILDQNGQPVTQLDEPITLAFAYDDSGMTESDEKALKLYKWDQYRQKWVPVESSVDIENNIISATVHVDENVGMAINGQSSPRANSGSLDLALFGRERLYLPTIQ